MNNENKTNEIEVAKWIESVGHERTVEIAHMSKAFRWMKVCGTWSIYRTVGIREYLQVMNTTEMTVYKVGRVWVAKVFLKAERYNAGHQVKACAATRKEALATAMFAASAIEWNIRDTGRAVLDYAKAFPGAGEIAQYHTPDAKKFLSKIF